MAIQLRRAGIAFTILERADAPAHLNSFSFAPRHDWSTRFPRQPQILAYPKRCMREHGSTSICGSARM